MQILKSRGVRQSVFTVGGSLMGTAISALAIILFIRILGPEKYGEFSVGFAIVLMLNRLNDAGLNQTIVKFASENKSKKDKNFIYSFALKYKLIFSTLIAILGIIFYEAITTSLKLTEPKIVLLSFTFGLVTVYYEYLMSVLQSLHFFRKIVFISWIQAGVKLSAALTLYFLNQHQLLPPYFWYIFATFIPVLLWKKLVPKWLKINFKTQSKKLSSKIIPLAAHASIGLIAAGIIENVDILFIQRHLTTYETGLYGGISRIALLFSIMAYSLGNVLNARVAKYRSKKDLQPYLKKALILGLLIILSFSLFIPFARPLIFYTIGAEFLSGELIMLVLTASSFLALAAIPFIAAFFALDSDWYFSVSGILQLLIVLGGNLIFVPQYGLWAAAWTRFATRSFLLIFTLISALMVYKKKYGKLAK